jgi:acyl-CoA thioester hydrolase
MGESFVHRLRVRYAECDRQEVVFNSHYLAYFDISMTELARVAFGSYGTLIDRGFDTLLAEAQLSFRGSARFDDELELAIAVERIGRTSLLCRHGIRRGGELLTEGTTRHVFVDSRTMVKSEIPPWICEALSPWCVQPSPDRALGPSGA